MGAYSVPQEIRALKPVGTIVKCIKGKYYVYTHSQHKDIKTGKWKTDAGKLIGKIVPDVGYIPNLDTIKNKGITCFDYGQYLLSCSLAKENLDLLKKFFTSEEAMQLYALASIIAVKGYEGLTIAEEYYERSLIAHDYPCLKFSYKRISKLLELIGRQDDARKFQRRCLENSDKLAIDGHVIASSSENNELSSLGYKSSTINSNQMNLMLALDINTSSPVAVKFYPGYMLDKSDFSDFIEHCGSIKNKIILIDKGFYKDDNINLIVNEEAFYIIPLSENHKQYKNVIKDIEETCDKNKLDNYFFYNKDKKTDLVEYKEYKLNDKTVIYYKNISEAEKLSKNYLKELEKGSKGYTKEKYNQLVDTFGVIVLSTNLNKDVKDIYNHYKNRWSIETYYDRLKNVIKFKELNLGDYATIQGLAFVMLIAGRIDAKISKAAKEVKLSRKELLQLASFLKITDIDGKITIHNQKKQHFEVFEKLNISMDTTKKCLS